MVTVSGNSNPTNPTCPTNPTNPTNTSIINSGELTDKNPLFNVSGSLQNFIVLIRFAVEFESRHE